MSFRSAIAWLLYGAVIVAVLVVFGVFIFQLSRGPAQPFEYTRDEYQAEHFIYAPGETLVYTPTLTVKRSGVFDTRRGWRTRPAAQRARDCAGNPIPPIVDNPPPFPPDAIDTDVETRVAVPVPNLPPGDYWLVSSVTKPDGGESITKVAFRVLTPCG